MIVRIYETVPSGSREAGRLRWDGAAIHLEAATPEE